MTRFDLPQVIWSDESVPNEMVHLELGSNRVVHRLFVLRPSPLPLEFGFKPKQMHRTVMEVPGFGGESPVKRESEREVSRRYARS